MADRVAPSRSGVNSDRPAWGGTARNGVCPDCMAEISDPRSRRYRFPFVSCPECGPGYTITYRLPFSRDNTTMAPFEICDACLAEYEDPSSRHFASPTICCPDCGPTYWIEPTPPIEDDADVVEEVVRLLAAGSIVALKDTCSFRLVVRADAPELIERLRRRVDLPGVPLGLMVSSLEMGRAYAEIDESAAELLESPSSPMVLLPLRADAGLPWEITVGAEDIALMLPRAPIHHMMLAAMAQPVVVARAGRGGDVPVLENEDARNELADVADHLVLHDLGLHAGCEDSQIRVEPHGVLVLRRASGFAPRPLHMPHEVPSVMGIGGSCDVTIAVAHGRVGYLSQPVGDMRTQRAELAFTRTLDRTVSLWDCQPRIIAHDPTRSARARSLAAEFGARTLAVDHHHAHVAAVLAEHGRTDRVLGLSLDSSGHEVDAELGSGRLLVVDPADFDLVECMPGFRVAGAEAAPRDPWRAALGLLHDLLDPAIAARWAPRLVHDEQTARSALSMLESGAGCTRVQSFGRLYDAAAAVLGVARRTSLEGQASERLEVAAGRPPLELPRFADSSDAGTDPRTALGRWVGELLDRVERGDSTAETARWVQITLARWIGMWAVRVARSRELSTVAAAGGCLTNPWLRHVLRQEIEAAGFELLLNQSIPPGDGGLALGQIWVAAHVVGAPEQG